MPLRVYNTLTRTLESFVPLKPDEVRMYACGVTVYDLCHIGHARSALVFDVIRRYLEYAGYRVLMVRNFTDVDDKIIARARERGVAWDALAREFIDAFYVDMDSLGLRRADVEPKATDHIPEMTAIIARLVERGLAYAVDGDVYYAVRDFPGYGKLSHRSPDDLYSGARIEVDDRKRDPLDFALWKASRPGEPSWESPWGPGRPGWHIECSAMAAKYLGDSFDIHAGGEDLIFPHHENEIAQSEGASGAPLARYWLHNGFVTVGGEKMSKSLGNFVTIREALGRFPADALKLLLLSTNYRGPLDYTEAAVAEKVKALQGLQEFLRAVDLLQAEAGRDSPAANPPAISPATHPAELAFRAAMEDDFSTARAMGALFDLVREGNRLLQDARQGGAPPASMVVVLTETADLLKRLGSVLALNLSGAAVNLSTASAVRLMRSVEAAAEDLRRLLAADPPYPQGFDTRLADVVRELLALREAARQRRAWAEADAIRRTLGGAGIRVDDTRTACHAISEFPLERGLPAVNVSLVRS
jgi:cysteinyl-tRNA synthetase